MVEGDPIIDLVRVRQGEASTRSRLVSRHTLAAGCVLLGGVAVMLVGFLPMML